MSDQNAPANENQISPELLEIMVCPVTRSPLHQEGDELVSKVGGLRYLVKGGIPILLADEAKLPEGIATMDEFKAKFKEQIP